MTTKKFEIRLSHKSLKIYAFHGERIPVNINFKSCGTCIIKNEDGGFIGKVIMKHRIEPNQYIPSLQLSNPDVAGRHHIQALCLSEKAGIYQSDPLYSDLSEELHEMAFED